MIVFNCMFFYVDISILLLHYILYCLCPFSVKDKAQEFKYITLVGKVRERKETWLKYCRYQTTVGVEGQREGIIMMCAAISE